MAGMWGLQLLLAIVATTAATTVSSFTKKPHIFLVLADDFGWHNIGYRNPEIKSPTLDKLAAQGIKLDRHYVFKYCSPTRSSLLSGRLPLHVNQNNECNSITSRSGIDIRMTLLPAKMKQAGYKTAMSGKWHCGGRSPANLPINRGFDSHLGFLKGGEDHNTQCLGDSSFPSGHGPDLWHNHGPAVGRNGTFSTLIYGPEIVRVVKAHPLPAPLFVYFPFQVTHSPYEVPQKYVDTNVDPERQIFNGMVAVMDEAVANLTAALTERSMLDDTLLLFSADNGGVYHGGQKGNNWPLRGQKTSSWEGGVRATAFLYGGANVLPSHLRGTTSEAFIHICDWYATLTKLVGVDPSDSLALQDGVPPIDSIDQWSVLMKPNATTTDSLRTEIPLAFCPQTVENRGTDNCCPTAEGGGWKPNGTKLAPTEWRNGALIRYTGKSWFKLIWGKQFGFGVRTSPNSPNASGLSHVSNDTGCPHGCLFDIIRDPTETTDLSRSMPTVFEGLIRRQQEIGLTVYQTNYSDFDDDAACITKEEMVEKYQGFLGPRCGVKL